MSEWGGILNLGRERGEEGGGKGVKKGQVGMGMSRQKIKTKLYKKKPWAKIQWSSSRPQITNCN